ncbi:MAG TPA: hypothetical protein VJH22_07465 [Candidatus Nanoarchaeia archaeon]|nr:hypothetical protein [Candidatus Nanoarchaeia archaeon]
MPGTLISKIAAPILLGGAGAFFFQLYAIPPRRREDPDFLDEGHWTSEVVYTEAEKQQQAEAIKQRAQDSLKYQLLDTTFYTPSVQAGARARLEYGLHSVNSDFLSVQSPFPSVFRQGITGAFTGDASDVADRALESLRSTLTPDFLDDCLLDGSGSTLRILMDSALKLGALNGETHADLTRRIDAYERVTSRNRHGQRPSYEDCLLVQEIAFKSISRRVPRD